MKSYLINKILLLAVLGASVTANLSAETVEVGTTAQLTDALAKASSGTTIHLSAGTYTGAVTLPAGVTLAGSGYGKSILDTGDAKVGITLAGDHDSVADLTAISHGGIVLSASGVKGIRISGVLARGGSLGFNFQQIDGLQLENNIVEGCSTGLVLSDVAHAGIVNNTFSHTDTVGVSLARVSDSAVFNNVVANGGVAIEVNRPGQGLFVDHNLYLALYTGKFNQEAARISVGPWRDVSGGLDAQSISTLPVVFRDAAHGDYQVVSTLDWNPNVATTSGWGVTKLGDFTAPAKDILGEARPANPGLGAREAAVSDAIPTDGTFTIKKDEGTKSAGVFTPEGTMLRLMFRDLPLKAGTYGFVLPSRDDQGKPFAAGNYELRLVESNLRWDYRRMVANNGVGNKPDEADSNSVGRVAFGVDHNLILEEGWSERAENARARDLSTGKAVWSLPGVSNPLGLCRGSDGLLYLLLGADPGSNPHLIRLDARGHLQPWSKGELRLSVASPHANGLAELGGNLYVSSTDGQVDRISIASGQLEPAFKVAQPFSLVADAKRSLLWMISGGNKFEKGTVTAYTPTGELKYSLKQVANPLGVAVNGNRLAIADYDAGKVRFFDITDPSSPVEQKALGRGDGPFGLILADRFWFQKGPYTPAAEVVMDLDETGRLAMRDGNHSRALVFDADGKSIYMSFNQFGNGPFWARFPGEESAGRFFDYNGLYTWTIDAQDGTWKPEVYWGRPPLGNGTLIGSFKYQDTVFNVYGYAAKDAAGKDRPGTLIMRYDKGDYAGKIAGFYATAANGSVVIHDTNQDGVIDVADGEGTPLTDSAGQPFNINNIFGRFLTVDPNGDIRNENSTAYAVFKGVDDQGNPIYEFPAAPAFAIDDKKLVSPYTFDPKKNPALYSESVITPDGELVAGISTPDSPHGTGLSNSGTVDLARFRKDGSLRWFLPMNDYDPIQGVKQVSPGFILTSWGHQAEWIGLDEDGLSLGHLGFPAEAHWSGYWVDHPTHYRLFLGNDGKVQVLVGDYNSNCMHWLSLKNYDDYLKETYPFAVSDARAAALAAEAPQTTFLMGHSEKPTLLIKKLDQPLAIDGDLEKWRKLGLNPQIVITPATGGANIKNARESSSVIRLAYEGNNVYAQVLHFVNVVTLDHTIAEGTQLQDTVEMMVNGFFPDGFQFSISKFSTDGDQVVRRRFFGGNFNGNIPADVAPTVTKVLDNAQDVPERKLIEAVTGEDLSQDKVVVTEVKLPIDERSWPDPKTLFPMESGKGFYLGFMIDSNDVPGTDCQKLEVWPACFNTFSGKEESAKVTLE